MAQPAVLDRLQALVDPTRARLLHILARQELTVGELCAVVQLPQSTVSRHLKLLSDEGWVATRAEGTSRYYRLDPDLNAGARQLWDLVAVDLSREPQAEADVARTREVVSQRRRKSSDYFARSAAEWEKVRETLFGDRASLIGLFGLLDDSAVVGDLGCGTGHLTQLLAPFVARVIGVDASPAMLAVAREHARELPNVELHVGELEQLPLPDGSLDAAILALVLHNVADPSHVVREALRAVRPGGRLVIVDMVPHSREELRQRLGHVWQGFSSQQVAKWFQHSGGSRVRYVPLPVDTSSEGPALFAASAVRSAQP
jgi:SAM-dependent methyltransferase